MEIGEAQREAFPQTMHATGHQIVHDVVVAGDGVKYTANAARFLAPRDLLVTKISRFAVAHGTRSRMRHSRLRLGMLVATTLGGKKVVNDAQRLRRYYVPVDAYASPGVSRAPIR